jgi:hypothetical protein
MPQSLKNCIKSWKKLMPDYKIMRWDESNFDTEKYAASKYALKTKKYALVSDVCRYNVLYKYGGIYLDTDVEVFERFDRFLDADFFSAIELYPGFYEEGAPLLDENGNPKIKGTEIPHLEILTSTMACVPQNEMIGKIRNFYNSIDADENYAINYRLHVNNDRFVARHLTEYGFRYVDKEQHLEHNFVVYPTGIFGHALCLNSDYSVSYHHNAASWGDGKPKDYKFALTMDKLHLLPLYKKYKKIRKNIKKILKKL